MVLSGLQSVWVCAKVVGTSAARSARVEAVKVFILPCYSMWVVMCGVKERDVARSPDAQ